MTMFTPEEILENYRKITGREPPAEMAARLLGQEPEPEPEVDADLIPDPGPTNRSPEQDEIDAYLERIDILDAYRKWCGKMNPDPGGKRESIMISCPKPDHHDANPSAWVNLDKQVWTCGTCGFEGGDKFDIAAYHFGFDVPGYKRKEHFPELKRRMVQDFFGVSFTKNAMGHTVLKPPPEPDPEPEPPKLAVVTPIAAATPTPANPFEIPWESFTEADTFLDQWMTATKDQDQPDEFYFWMGLQALGLACGFNATIPEDMPVKGNLFIVLYADSGGGKSRAISTLRRLISEALPFNDTAGAPSGVKIENVGGSAEALMSAFETKLDISGGATPMLVQYPVRALIEIDELADMVSKSARQGFDMRPTVQKLFDFQDGETYRHRTRTKGTMEIKSAFASLLSSTQTESVETLLNKYDMISGFLNRFIFARGRNKPVLPIRKSHELDISDPIKSLKAVHKWAKSKRQIDWTDASGAQFVNFYHDEIAPIKEDANRQRALMSRLDLHIKKLALLFAINEKSPVIETAHLDKARALLNYIVESYDNLAMNVDADDDERAREWIIHQLEVWHKRKPGEWCYVSYLFSKVPKKFKLHIVSRQFDLLVKTKQIEFETIKGTDKVRLPS